MARLGGWSVYKDSPVSNSSPPFPVPDTEIRPRGFDFFDRRASFPIPILSWEADLSPAVLVRNEV